MTQRASPSESQRPSTELNTGSEPGWRLVLLSSAICIAGTAVAVVLTLLF